MCSWEGEVVVVVDGGNGVWCVGMVMVGVSCCEGLV
jgi:hypothetical protein